MRFSCKAFVITAFAAISFISAPSHSDDVFKSSEFLEWERNSQEFYIRTSVGMAILIADQNDKEKAMCISGWIGENEENAYNLVLHSMKRFPEFHPRATILAVIEKNCGALTF